MFDELLGKSESLLSKEQTNKQDISKEAEIKKLEEERDAEIEAIESVLPELEFVKEGKIPKETVTVTNKKGEEIGQKDVAREDLVNKQNDIKERSEKLKKLIECLTGKKG